MKLLVSFVVLCAIACAVEAQRRGSSGGRLGGGGGLKFPHRFRRSPQGSIMLEAQQPLSGPNRQPSLDINYQHQLIDDGRTKLNVFGGANLQNGHVTPQAGFGAEHRFKNDIFVHGGGQVQPGPRGRLEPTFGAGVGWRFRREAMPYEKESVYEEEIEEAEETQP